MAEAKNDNATNNDNQSNNNDKETTTSSFLSSMTFASMRDCECDECDAACGMNFASLPSSIAEAITRHKKRLKLQDDVDEEEKKKKEQERSLVCRSREGISVWKWTLPMGAEPLIEYGNSHRIVFVEDIAKHAKIQSIGKGIIGSSEEERTRTNVSWNKQSAYIIKCNGGKALGFTQSSHAIIPPNDDDNDVNDDNNKKEGEEEKDVVLYIFKIMPKTLLAYDDGKKKKKKDDWIMVMLDMFHKILIASSSEVMDEVSSSSSSSDNDLFELEKEECMEIQKCLSSLLEESNT